MHSVQWILNYGEQSPVRGATGFCDGANQVIILLAIVQANSTAGTVVGGLAMLKQKNILLSHVRNTAGIVVGGLAEPKPENVVLIHTRSTEGTVVGGLAMLKQKNILLNHVRNTAGIVVGGSYERKMGRIMRQIYVTPNGVLESLGM